jgi:membrane protease YdiL (CAAX protease family)
MTYSVQQWSQIWSSIDIWVFTVILSCAFPFAGYLLFGHLKKLSANNRNSKKLRTYAYVILSEWAFVIALIWLTHRHGFSISDLGENLGNVNLTFITIAVLLAVFAFMVYFNIRQIRQMSLEKLEAELGSLKIFLPNNKPEFMVFILIAFTAGICEELLYRGWLQNLLAYGTGSAWIGLVMGAVIFGFGHSYQGKIGIVQTGIYGLLFGGVFIFTKSLVAGQVLHVIIDSVNGIVGGYAYSLLNVKS